MLLRHERRTILEATAENVLAFDEAVYDLRRERMLTAAHLKAGELKLLVLRQVNRSNCIHGTGNSDYGDDGMVTMRKYDDNDCENNRSEAFPSSLCADATPR